MFKKVFVLMFALFMSAVCVPAFAQDVSGEPPGVETAAVGLTTFTGITAKRRH